MASTTLTVRRATRADALAVAEIYNQGIRGRGATFETTERTAADVLAWLDAPDAAAHPFLVAERRSATTEIVGWVRASGYRARACYAGIAEFSFYVASSARGQRVGDALMCAFIPACADAGLWKLLSRIFPENTPSRALCARHGFREVGTYEKHAKLDGVWRDVIIVERLLPENQG
jgi:phosphinothricin acetyltransferase